jgi:hypothetical protein
MALEKELLSIEQSLWKGGVDAYRRALDDDCLVAFVQQAGVSSREEVAGTVEGAPRWKDLEMQVEGLLQPTPDIAILTYRASAVRGEGDEGGEEQRYRALISSGYVKRHDAWKLMFHQQTPLQN